MVTSNALLLNGIVVGLSIAVPIGPMGLLCIQRTLQSGMRIGVCIGLGAATVNVTYGLAIILGFGSLTALLPAGARVLSFVGGLFLLWSASRTWARGRRPGVKAVAPTLSPAGAYGSAVALNLANPMGPALIVALLSPVVATDAPSWTGTATFLLGMFVAAVSWWVCLSGTVSLLRTRLSPSMLSMVNRAAAAMLTVYGAWRLHGRPARNHN